MLTLKQKKVAKHAIKVVKAGEIHKLDTADTYVGPVGVGRISILTWQVELLTMVAPDPTASPARNVKTVLDLSPVDPNDSAQVDAAMALLGMFYDAKRGYTNDMGPLPVPVAKLISIAYDPANVVQDTLNCMGADLEVLDQGSTTVKHCYRVRPSEIIQSGL